LDDHEFIVFAGVLSEKSKGAESLRARKSKRLHVIQLDVTSEVDVSNAEMTIQSICGEEGI